MEKTCPAGLPSRLTLSSEALHVALIPAWGAKLVSLRMSDGYDFMAPAPFGPHTPDRAVFAPEDAYGFDEMFPGCQPERVEAGAAGAFSVSDHGDLWYRAWTVEREGESAHLWTEEAHLGWRFAKYLRFSDPLTLECQYTVTNAGPHPLPWLYYSHILLPFHEGIELEAPASIYERQETLGAPTPERCTGTDGMLTRFEDFPDRSAAFYASGRLEQRACTYRDRRAGKALALRWSAPLDYLALWYNRGGWMPNRPVQHMGLEPATASWGGLAQNVRDGVADWLAPGARVAWTLTLAVSDQAATKQNQTK